MDFAAEGLLDGLEGEARVAREQLLEKLVEDGATLAAWNTSGLPCWTNVSSRLAVDFEACGNPASR